MPAQKAFSWSYSKLKNFETCAYRHQQVDLLKNYKDEEGEALLYGNAVHDMLAKYIGKAEPIPEMHKPDLQGWGDYAVSLRNAGMQVAVEQKLAITEQFGPCAYFSNFAWFRGVADVLAIKGPVAVLLDWKTGKVLDDSQQLALSAACVFAHHPAVQRVRTQFVWIKDACTTTADFERGKMAAMWAGIWPRIERLKTAHQTNNYPPTPSGLCRRYCVVESCQYHGKGG